MIRIIKKRRSENTEETWRNQVLREHFSKAVNELVKVVALDRREYSYRLDKNLQKGKTL